MTGLEYILEQKKIPQKTLAAWLKVPPASVNTWVKGKVDVPEKHILKLMDITHVDQSLIINKDITDKEKVLIQIQILSAEDFGSEKMEYLETKYDTWTVLDVVRRYIETHNLKTVEKDVYTMDKESIRNQYRNTQRISDFIEIAEKIDDKAIDDLLRGMLRIVNPNIYY